MSDIAKGIPSATILVKSEWGGGYLLDSVTGKKITSVHQLPELVNIFKDDVLVGGGRIRGEVEIKGVDHDHGHEYPWVAFDLDIALVPSGIGVNVRDLDRQGYQVRYTQLGS